MARPKNITTAVCASLRLPTCAGKEETKNRKLRTRTGKREVQRRDEEEEDSDDTCDALAGY